MSTGPASIAENNLHIGSRKSTHSQRECNRLYVNGMSNITADLLIDISVKNKKKANKLAFALL